MKKLVPLIALGLLFGALSLPASAATILPPGKTCFSDDNGAPLGGGNVGFYIPTTLTFKDTWQDTDQTTLNINPVPLDSAGCAVIYGSGVYRQIVKDSIGNTIWDQLTADSATAAQDQNYGGTSGGSGNNQVVTLAGFTGTDGQIVTFRAGFSNTGPMLINGIPLLIDSTGGPVPLVGGEVVTNNMVGAIYSTLDSSFHMINPATHASEQNVEYVPPGGRLTLVSGQPVDTVGVEGATTLYYTPYIGNAIVTYDGVKLVSHTFGELALALDPNTGHTLYHQENRLFDVFVISDLGTLRLCTGPQWSVSAPGTSDRGDAAGTTALVYNLGNLSNKYVMSCRFSDGASDFRSVPVFQATYLGTVYTGVGTRPTVVGLGAGQITNFFMRGLASGKVPILGVWNNYNRVAVLAQQTDDTAGTYTYANVNGIRVAGGGTNSLLNRIYFIQGRRSGTSIASYRNRVVTSGGAGDQCNIGLGLNSPLPDDNAKKFPGVYINNVKGFVRAQVAGAAGGLISITYVIPSGEGLNFLTGLESTVSTTCTYGTPTSPPGENPDGIIIVTVSQ